MPSKRPRGKRGGVRVRNQQQAKAAAEQQANATTSSTEPDSHMASGGINDAGAPVDATGPDNNNNNAADDLANEEPLEKKTRDIAGSQKRKSKYNSPEEATANHRSPLAKAKLRELLTTETTWSSLTNREKAVVLIEYPSLDHIINPDTYSKYPPIPPSKNSDSFHSLSSEYQSNLGAAVHDPDFMYQAREYNRARDLAGYQLTMARRYQQDWGITMPADSFGPLPAVFDEEHYRAMGLED
ncbi:hypothetical protein F4780DRAFT_745705 [Xylariomycetidae sp. FL0641]|nr:hypothetical protein F4780DRAFT_745705 [Xylariomycetidae sp. FL0641]